MANVYNQEFKKQLVKEYIQGKRYSILAKEYAIAKSTLSDGLKNTAKNANFYNHTPPTPLSFLQKKYKNFTREWQNWKKRTFS